MIQFFLNGNPESFDGDGQVPLLRYLRDHKGIISVKDGCSGQAACGACLLEVDGQATLACVTPMKKINGTRVVTIEGFPEALRRTLGRVFATKGAVQCGFCSPGFLSRAKILLQTNPHPTREEIIEALRFNLCRCTGYAKIIEAIEYAAEAVREKREIEFQGTGRIGTRQPKYGAFEKAVGQSPFVNDISLPGMLYGALKFSDHPRAKVVRIDLRAAENMAGVVRVFTGRDIPGQRHAGLMVRDWPLMVLEGEITRYIGDVLAGVVAETEEIARRAVKLIRVDYEPLEPLVDMESAESSPIKVHPAGNLLRACIINRGEANIADVFAASAHAVQGVYHTQRVEHAFLETEAAIAAPWLEDGIRVLVQSQGIYEDQRQIAQILNIPETKVNVVLVPSGGAFGGKEDLTVQGHAALFSHHLKRPVQVRLNRPESMRMHPKRHPMRLEYKLACNADGQLTALQARILGDTGAYASVGAEVLERAAAHATGAYFVPHVDIAAKAVFTNNIPSGAMRGFGVNQVTFAMESSVEALCEKGGFDRWQFRYDNALTTGKMTVNGQVLGEGVGLRQTLLAVKDEFYKSEYAGLACALKNCGIGNGVPDECEVKLEITADNHIILHHGWTEMGQGIDTVGQQILCEALGIDTPEMIEVKTDTVSGARAGVTTASRATMLLGNAVLDAARKLKQDLTRWALTDLSGHVYEGHWQCDWTTRPGEEGEVVSHFAYGYATHLVILDQNGRIDSVIAAHDAGKVINPTLFEGQIQGAVVMGLGYALTEDLPMEDGRLKTDKLSRLGLFKAKDVPRIIVKGIEAGDPIGPYGAKGVGEIGTVPTAAAVANALYQYDHIRRYALPLRPRSSRQNVEGEFTAEDAKDRRGMIF